MTALNLDIPQFETERLILREVQITDFSCYERHFADYEVIRHLYAVVPWPFPKNGVADFYTTAILPGLGKDRWLWGIFLKENPSELIGAVDLWRNGIPENRGFWLGRKFWGQGFMTEAVLPITAHAFEALGFEKLIFSKAVGNQKSHRIKEKTGARLIGVEPAKFVDPIYTEREIWEFTKSDWNKINDLTK